MRVNLHLQISRAELAQDFRFVGARQRVPLSGRAAAGQQHERKLGVGLFGQCARLIENETRLAVRVAEPSVLEQAALASFRGTVSFVSTKGPRPLNSARPVDVAIIRDAS